MSGFSTVGLPAASIAAGTLPLTGNERVAVDTGLPNGENPATEYVTVSQLTAVGFGNPVTLPYAANMVADVSTGSYFTTTLTGNANFSFINPAPGQEVILAVYQDGTGSRTITWSGVQWAGGTAPTLSTAANACDVLRFTYSPIAGKFRGEVVGKAFA